MTLLLTLSTYFVHVVPIMIQMRRIHVIIHLMLHGVITVATAAATNPIIIVVVIMMIMMRNSTVV